jgi:hypothetical protein
VQVSEFPSEFILLGRATVMIKGIANRLGLTWGLSDRWAKVARLAVAGRCHVIELHKTHTKYCLFIYSPICMDQIWTFNLVYTYADWSFL